MSRALAPFILLAMLHCPAHAQSLRLHFMDVGEGDAILLQWRGEKPEYILVDTGNPVTGHRALEYIRQQGATELAAVIITHPHMDHAGGLFQIAQSLPVRALYDNGEDPWKDGDPNPFYRWYREFFLAQPNHNALKAGEKLALGPAELEILWPPAEGFASGYINARSMVIMLRYGKFRALLAGDLIIPAEQALARSGVELSAVILKAGHHAAEDTGSTEFLTRVRPRNVIISVDSENANGYPSSQVIQRMEALGARIFMTGREGDIVVEAEADGKFQINQKQRQD